MAERSAKERNLLEQQQLKAQREEAELYAWVQEAHREGLEKERAKAERRAARRAAKAAKKAAKKQKKRKASSSEEEAKPAAKAKNRELEQKAVPQVTLSLGDASEEEPEGESPYADWPQPNRVVFAAAVQEAQLAQKATSKSEKLTLSGLVSVMDNIPETALKHHQLEEVLTTLKKMERLPKKEKVELILESLQALADAANAKPVLAEMPPGLKTPTEEAPEETEAPEDKDASKEKEDEAKEAEEADDKETWAVRCFGMVLPWLTKTKEYKKKIYS